MPLVLNGKLYRSYKHPILEYILEKRLGELSELPDEIIFTYTDIRQAMAALGIVRDAQASLSNFTIDLTRRASTHEARVPDTVWNRGYDLDRASEREARQGIAGRLVRIDLKAAESWIVWPEIEESNTFVIANHVPDEVKAFLGKDEGALLSVMDYCDVLSLVLIGVPDSIKRVQHPKKWQPGEVDGLYYTGYNGQSILYPVEAKALSTGDHVNLAQIQGAYRTIVGKITTTSIIPLAVQMTSEGMFIAVFEATQDQNLVVTQFLKVILDPPLDAWQKRPGKTRR
jgi:hypothetical protein